MQELGVERRFQFSVVDDLVRRCFAIFECRCLHASEAGRMRIKLALARVRVGAGVEGFAPDAVGDDSVEDIDAIVEMDEVDVGIRVFNRLAGMKKPARVAPAADQPGKADDGRPKSPALPEQVFDDDQGMIC